MVSVNSTSVPMNSAYQKDTADVSATPGKPAVVAIPGLEWESRAMKDKRESCGCHLDCDIGESHDCDNPCIWPNCLSDTESLELVHDMMRAQRKFEEPRKNLENE